MASVVPGYTFLNSSDPITYSKLNLLSQPTVTIGVNEVVTSMIANNSVTNSKLQKQTGVGFLGQVSTASSANVFFVTLGDGNIGWPTRGIALSDPATTEMTLGRTNTTRLKMSYGEPSAKATIFVGGAGTSDITWGNGDTDWIGGTFTYSLGNGSTSAQQAMRISLSSGAPIATFVGLFSSSPTAGLGYSTGAGGVVTQITNRTTSVTLNKVTGQITTNNASLAALASATFTVLNNTIAATDTVVANIASGAVNDKTIVTVNHVVAGTSFSITVYNADAVTAETGAIVINFAVIKAVAS